MNIREPTNGDSTIMFADYLWKYVNKRCQYQDHGELIVYYINKWFIEDTTPDGFYNLASSGVGASPTTDADNIIKPRPTGMAYDMRFSQADKDQQLCLDEGSEFDQSTSYSYTLGVSFEFKYRGLTLGQSSTNTGANSRSIQFHGGNCWEMNSGGLAEAYNWMGPDSKISPRAAGVSISGRGQGCDIPNQFEDELPEPFDVGTYRYAGTAEGVTQVRVQGNQAFSRAYEVVAYSSGIQDVSIRGDGTFYAATPSPNCLSSS